MMDTSERSSAEASLVPTDLLPKDHTILERAFMEFRPFGVNEQGEKIRDVSGVTVRANVDYLQEFVARTAGNEAGERAVQELSRLLNERLRDPVYHVTPAFLRNVWHSYGAEFVAYLREFCLLLSGDPEFSFNVGREKHLGHLIQVLGRPFSLQQIYWMIPHFSDKFAKGSWTETLEITDHSAILRRGFNDHTSLQYGPYRRRCAELICQAFKGSLIATPEKIHHLPPAMVTDRACIAYGDQWCEWEVTWSAKGGHPLVRPFRGMDARKAIGRFIRQRPVADIQYSARQREDADLLAKEHTILERPIMEFRPFGNDEQGQSIKDVSGLLIRDNVEYMEECVARAQGADAGARAVDELCLKLNRCIRDSAYHVTPAFLKRVWNSYSYEFASYVRELCKELSGDPQFHYNVGKTKHISPLIQTLGRPFPLSQIHKMYPYFAHKYAQSLECTAVSVTDGSAVLRLQFPEPVLHQFGIYRKACAFQTCESSKGRIGMVPVRVHGLPASIVRDRACIVKGDDFCEWEVTWTPTGKGKMWWVAWGVFSGLAVSSLLLLMQPDLPLRIAVWAGIAAAAVSLLGAGRLRRHAKAREAVIHEQVQFVEARHEELREAYLEQEKIQVELRRKVNQLTTLHSAGLLFGSTLDPETLLQNVLETLVHQLHYDRAMISRFDPERRVAYDSRVLGVSQEIAAYARSHEVAVTDPEGFEGTVLLQGKPLLVGDVRQIWDRLHPRNQQLAAMTNAKSVIAVPVKVKDRILGALTVDRTREHSLTEDDRALLETFANQVAIALDNAAAYQEIESLNVGLEERIRDRTVQLEAANHQLTELNRLKSEFVNMVSHELRTPMTSMRIYVSNMLDGVIGTLTDKQKQYLSRIEFNIDRLTRMIIDLLDLSRIESGRVDLRLVSIAAHELTEEVVENLRSLASGKAVTLACAGSCPVPLQADRDKLTQILTNLVGNAIKYTPTGGTVRVMTEVTEDEEGIQFCVADTGCGIRLEELPKVFDKFFRGMANTAETHGAGLGLAIVKNLVEMHGGRVWVESTVGQGTSFYFVLPVNAVVGAC